MVGPYRPGLGPGGFNGALTDQKLWWAGGPNFSLLKLSGLRVFEGALCASKRKPALALKTPNKHATLLRMGGGPRWWPLKILHLGAEGRCFPRRSPHCFRANSADSRQTVERPTDPRRKGAQVQQGRGFQRPVKFTYEALCEV